MIHLRVMVVTTLAEVTEKAANLLAAFSFKPSQLVKLNIYYNLNHVNFYSLFHIIFSTVFILLYIL